MSTDAWPLADLPVDDFLANYWQKQALVIRQAFPGFQSPISAEELAGLACEEDVSSRIVMEKGGEHPWYPIEGPMDESIFADLPETHWTLLVNDVEKHLPALAQITDRFRFLPEWLFDDLMISYAPQGGSVGPHLDYYDVFILQAQGHRRWQISTAPVDEDNQVDGTPLRIQRQFTAEQEWLLAPGDMIYIPPGVSHYGVATDDCLSFSIGFRSMSHGDMVNDYIGFITRDLPADRVFTLPNPDRQAHPNEITPATLEQFGALLQDYLKQNPAQVKAWLGHYLSDNKTDLVMPPETRFYDFQALVSISDSSPIIRNPASRFVYTRESNMARMFIDSREMTVTPLLAEALCNHRAIDMASLRTRIDQTEQQLVVQLYNAGHLITED